MSGKAKQRSGEKPGLCCSFCGKHQDDPRVRKIIAGPGVYICDECIALSVDILSGEGTESKGAPVFRVVARRPDGQTATLEYGPLPETTENKTWLQQCRGCGTWVAGEEVTDCLHCGQALRR